MLTALAFSLLFARLGDRALLETSEARYAETAREMYLTGDWMIPRFLGIKHFHKPPLTYWITECGYGLFGVTELGARFFLASAGLAVLALTFWLGRVCFGERAALLGTGILLLTPLFGSFARVLTTDLFLTLFTTASIAAFVAGRRGHRPAFLLMWLLAGASFMTKGPIGVILIAAAVLPSLVHNGELRKQLSQMYPLAGPALFVVVALPWYIALVLETPGLLDYWLLHQTIDRVATTVHKRSGPVYYFLGVFLVGFFPWSLFVPGAVRESWSRFRGREQTWEPLFFWWFLLPFILFSLSQSKLITYILPLMPPAALLLGAWMDRCLEQPAVRRLTAVPVCAGAWTVSLALAGLLWVKPLPESEAIRSHLIPTLVVFLAWAIVATRSLLASVRFSAIVTATVVAGLVFPVLIAPFADRAELHYKTMRPLVRAIPELPEAPAVVLCRLTAASVPFYLGRPVYTFQCPRDLQFEDNLPQIREHHLETLDELLDLLTSRTVFLIGKPREIEQVNSIQAGRTGHRLTMILEASRYMLATNQFWD